MQGARAQVHAQNFRRFPSSQSTESRMDEHTESRMDDHEVWVIALSTLAAIPVVTGLGFIVATGLVAW